MGIYLLRKKKKKPKHLMPTLKLFQKNEKKCEFDKPIWRFNNTKEKWLNNGSRNIFTNIINFEIHM